MTGNIDVHITYTAPGVELTVQVTRSGETALAEQVAVVDFVIGLLAERAVRPITEIVTAAPDPESSTVTGEGEANADEAQEHETAGESSGSPATPPPAPARRAPVPHPRQPVRIKPKGAHRDSAQTRLLNLLADGPLTGTLEEIADDVDCSYGALRQLLTKAVAKGAITRTRDGKHVTLALPGDAGPGGAS